MGLMDEFIKDIRGCDFGCEICFYNDVCKHRYEPYGERGECKFVWKHPVHSYEQDGEDCMKLSNEIRENDGNVCESCIHNGHCSSAFNNDDECKFVWKRDESVPVLIGLVVAMDEKGNKFLFWIPSGHYMVAGDKFVFESSTADNQIATCCCDSFFVTEDKYEKVCDMWETTPERIRRVVGALKVERWE